MLKSIMRDRICDESHRKDSHFAINTNIFMKIFLVFIDFI